MKKILGIATLMFIAGLGFAKEDVPRQDANDDDRDRTSYRNAMKFGNDCEPATQQADLDVNNVRTKILNGGDMWWDLTTARYEIPKITGVNAVRKHSMFAGAIWIGGLDLGENLKLAAMTYRQRGSDFWPGPLDELTSNTNANQCLTYDQIFKVDGSSIIEHVESIENGTFTTPSTQIAAWPGKGNFGDNMTDLAPFFDTDGDGFYEPAEGDYPVLQSECLGEELDNEPEDQPDQMLWFVYNDKGNIHSETQGEPIGVEIQTTAFAFATNDEVNDMTFYTSRIINRGFTQLKQTYFGQWVDPDLGNFSDDYVGCDVGLSLGFCYNGDDNDEGVLGYGLNPPSIGVDFFEGPKIDTIIDGVPTRYDLGMSKFVYYNNNTNPINGNPNTAIQFYNYLRGRWMNGTQIEFGGDGITGTNGTPADYMFPFDTDPEHPNENWNERSAGNQPLDRRFLQSSGPFILEPGAVQKLTVGVVWARSSYGGAEGSLSLLKIASQKAQELFNACFDLVDGPDAPEIEVQELDQQLVISLGGTGSDRVEKYEETVINGLGEEENYTFQGYRVFQLKDATVSLSELGDVNKAREVFQCDIEDEFGTIVNRVFDPDVQDFVPTLEVRGENDGIQHSISLTEDAFATGSNKTLVNHKTYYYIVLAYAAGESTNRTYLEGRKVKQFSAIPRKTEPRLGGSNTQANYGSGPKLTRVAGTGNGGNVLELTPESEEAILANNQLLNPTYMNGNGPVKISVIDPLKVPNGDFELTLLEENITRADSGVEASKTNWILKRILEDGSELIVRSDTEINYRNEQVILASTVNDTNVNNSNIDLFDWGLAVTIEQVVHPGEDEDDPNNGFISYNVVWEDPSKEWLTAVEDRDVATANAYAVYDWIRSGVQGGRESSAYGDPTWHDYALAGEPIDPGQAYERIWPGPSGGGRVAPYRLVANNGEPATPGRNDILVQAMAYNLTANGTVGINNIASIDLVITKDQSKWSECVMIEIGEDDALTEGGVEKFDLRAGQLTWAGGTLLPGKTIFPGYAINLETGERLNIIVAEDSYQVGENGRDMKWNPTDNAGFYSQTYPSYGGRHYIYVMGSHEGPAPSLHPKLPIYDKGNEYWNRLSNMTPASRSRELTAVFQNCMWVIP
ncbi:hypothetical protein GYB22_09645, partial [bacterium]|nr:hypothetical protein [bacterium]